LPIAHVKKLQQGIQYTTASRAKVDFGNSDDDGKRRFLNAFRTKLKAHFHSGRWRHGPIRSTMRHHLDTIPF
jgi:hypothetical protein